MATTIGKLPVQVPLDLGYTELVTGSTGLGTIVLLHGYKQTKDKLMRHLAEPLTPYADRIIAVNGPFPVPFEREGIFKEAYSWYFSSTKDNRFLIPASVSEYTFKAISKEFDLIGHETTVIGYSQGGFALPWFGRVLPTTKKLIGLACGHVERFFPEKLDMPLYSIHGEDDHIIPVDLAEKQFQDITSRTAGGQFIKAKGSHGLSEPMIAALIELLK